MRQVGCQVKNFVWYLREFPYVFLWKALWITRHHVIVRRQNPDFAFFRGSTGWGKKSSVAQIFGIDFNGS